MHRSELTPRFVADLVASQFPQWAGLPVRPVEHDGWDNATFRLGDDLAVRLPSNERYSAQVEKEHRWLPYLAPYLPLPVPQPVGQGVPGNGFPRPWSVYGWLPGTHATVHRVADQVEFARSLGTFLTRLYAVPDGGGPPSGQHNFFRGASPGTYDDETRETVAYLADELDAGAVLDVWDASLATPFSGTPVWLHGDLSASNLLVVDGRLSAVIDFGTTAVGDPACDLAIGWTFFSGESRRVFRDVVGLDDAAWARGRGWTLWKALIVHAEARRTDPARIGTAGLQYGWRCHARALVDDVVADAIAG